MSRVKTTVSPQPEWLDWIKTPVPPWLFILVLLATLGMSMKYRLDQLDTWRENPERYFHNDMPMLTTADGYYWTRMAKLHFNGQFDETVPDKLRGYPDDPPKYSPSLLPLLISYAAKITGLNIYIASVYLVVFLSGLFIIPIGLYFYREGFPLVGLMGGIIGSIGSEYFIRTSIGRTDTDALSLFFFLAIAYFIYRSAPNQRWWQTILFSVLAAVFCRLFKYWYEHYFFYGIYFATLAGYLVIRRIPWKTALVALFLFLYILGPQETLGGLARVKTHINQYVLNADTATPISGSSSTQPAIILPNVANTITEHERFPFMQSLALTLTNPYLSLTGLVFVVLLLVLIGRSSIPLLPMFAMGCISLVKQRRFAMFLGPFIGMGLGLAVTLAMALLWRLIPQGRALESGGSIRWLKTFSLFLAGIFATYFLQPYTFASYNPDPKAFPEMVMHLEKLAVILPENAKLWNYWNYGYLLQDITERGTFTDGAMQSRGITYLMSRAFSASTAQEFHRIIAGVAKYSHTDLESLQSQPGNDFEKVTEQIANESSPVTGDPVYVVFTYNMLSQFSTIFASGTWDFSTGKGDESAYSLLHCQRQLSAILTCIEGSVDLTKGTLEDKAAIGHVLIIKDGKAVKHHQTGHDGFVLELIMADDQNILFPLLLRRPAYYSNFNQMYLMGKYDPSYFELTYDAFPHVRAYRVKPVPESFPSAIPDPPVHTEANGP